MTKYGLCPQPPPAVSAPGTLLLGKLRIPRHLLCQQLLGLLWIYLPRAVIPAERLGSPGPNPCLTVSWIHIANKSQLSLRIWAAYEALWTSHIKGALELGDGRYRNDSSRCFLWALWYCRGDERREWWQCHLSAYGLRCLDRRILTWYFRTTMKVWDKMGSFVIGVRADN